MPKQPKQRASVSEGQKKRKEKKSGGVLPRVVFLSFASPVLSTLDCLRVTWAPAAYIRSSPRPPQPRRHRPPLIPPPPPRGSEARFRCDRPSAPTAWALLLRDLAGPSGAGLGIRAHGVAARPHPGETPAWSFLRCRALLLYGDTAVASNLRSWVSVRDWGLRCWCSADTNNVCVYLVVIHGYLGSCLWGCLCWRNMQATDFGQTMIQFAFCNRYYFPLVIERNTSFSLACICMRIYRKL